MTINSLSNADQWDLTGRGLRPCICVSFGNISHIRPLRIMFVGRLCTRVTRVHFLRNCITVISALSRLANCMRRDYIPEGHVLLFSIVQKPGVPIRSSAKKHIGCFGPEICNRAYFLFAHRTANLNVVFNMKSQLIQHVTSSNSEPSTHRETVSTYYGKTLSSSSDLKTSACCPISPLSSHHSKLLQSIHPEILTQFYGCGTPIPEHLEGCRVLDLGCGTGRDVYLASALVGTNGFVTGIDMTDEQLDVAKRHMDYHMKAFGLNKFNVEFKKGVIENLKGAGIEDASQDVVISNCVCNLSPEKEKVFSEVHRVLKDGGEFYFSDVYCDRRLSEEARVDSEMVGECLGGALYVKDFQALMRKVGFSDIRIVSAGPISLTDERLRELSGGASFYSLTVRLFKVGSEYSKEDYGDRAIFLRKESFSLDIDHTFEYEVATRVDRDTAHILKTSRYSSMFSIEDGGDTHYGEFRTIRGPCLLGDVLDFCRPRQMSDAPSTKVQNCSPAAPRSSVSTVTNGSDSCGPPKSSSSSTVKPSRCAPESASPVVQNASISCCPPSSSSSAKSSTCAPESGPPVVQSTKASSCMPKSAPNGIAAMTESCGEENC